MNVTAPKAASAPKNILPRPEPQSPRERTRIFFEQTIKSLQDLTPPDKVEHSLEYARLLAGVGYPGLSNWQLAMPLENMTRHLKSLANQGSHTSSRLHKKEFEYMAEQLQFATQIAHDLDKACIIRFTTYLIPVQWSRIYTRRASEAILRELERKGRCTFPCGTAHHAMMMDIRLEAPTAMASERRYMIGIYNSSHAGRHQIMHSEIRRKAETQFQVKGVKLGEGQGDLNAGEIEKILALANGIQISDAKGYTRPLLRPQKPNPTNPIYQWALAKGERVQDPTDRVVQRLQKYNDCANECIMAFLRNNMSYTGYKTAKWTLMNDAADFLERRFPRLCRKEVARLRAKAQSARERAERGGRR